MTSESILSRLRDLVEDSQHAKQNLIFAYSELSNKISNKHSDWRLAEVNEALFTLITNLSIKDLDELGRFPSDVNALDIFSDWEQIKDDLSRNFDKKIDPWRFYKEGKFLAENGDLERAISNFKMSIYLKSDLSYSYFEMGKAFHKMGMLEEAIRLFEFCNRINPDFPWSYWKKGHALLKLGKIDDAIKTYQKTIELEDCVDCFHCSLGEAYIQLGDKQKAISAYQNAVKQIVLSSGLSEEDFSWESNNWQGPDFISPGFALSGINQLYECVIQHPQILKAAQKEPMFFNNNYDRGIDWYLSQFPHPSKEINVVTGEMSTRYIENPLAHSRLFEHFPQVKLIILLRNPTERAISDYLMGVARGYEDRGIDEVFEKEMTLLEESGIEALTKMQYPDFKWPNYKKYPSYLLGSLYLDHINRWMTLFPRNQFLIMKSEDFCENPQKILQQVFGFLGLSDFQAPRYEKYNLKNNIENEVIRKKLNSFFEPRINKLEEYLGVKFNWQ